jgi:hypothetical protein
MLKVLVDLSSTSHGWGYLAKYISSVNGVKAKSGISSNMQGINSQPISLMCAEVKNGSVGLEFEGILVLICIRP